MSMTRTSVATLLTMAVLALTAASPVDADKTRHEQAMKCDAGRGHVMTANPQALLYRASEYFEHSIVYGCVFTHHRSYRLGYFPGQGTCSSSGCIGIQHEALAGPIVAYESFSTSNEGGTFFVIVRNLLNGRVLHKVPTGTPFPPNPSVTGNGFALSIVVKSDGAVAWVTEYSEGMDTEHEINYYEVHALDKIGNRLLATGTDIDPHSLALAGSRLYWTQAGKPFSTRLD